MKQSREKTTKIRITLNDKDRIDRLKGNMTHAEYISHVLDGLLPKTEHLDVLGRLNDIIAILLVQGKNILPARFYELLYRQYQDLLPKPARAMLLPEEVRRFREKYKRYKVGE